MNYLHLWIEDEGGAIEIGKRNKVCGNTKISSIEGVLVTIGDDNLFSTNVDFKTGDSHSIISVQTGKRINPSMSIKVGNHNWFGHNVTILKGVELKENVIIGTGSIVTKSPEASNVILVGSPAKIIRQGITWNIERVSNF